MAYAVIKTWVPGEILTASHLNAEFAGKITNENDLDTRLTTEVNTRTTLEAEFDMYAINKLWTYQNTAPTGWNIVASTTDAVIACKGGSNAYNTTGGQQIGTWTQPNHTHTGPSHTHTGPSHTHTGPGHNHKWYEHHASASANDQTYNSGGIATNLSPDRSKANGYYALACRASTPPYDAWTAGGGTGATGAGGTGATGADGTGATGADGTGATYRPLANLGIIIEKT